ncbi:hypothetical protein Tco_1425116, partial [Tanacetum coccineum]
DHYQPYVSPRAPDRRYNNRRHDHRRQEVNHLRLDSLTKLPSEILATELQLQLLPYPPTVAPLKKENLDRYYEYHGEKGHYTNDCFHLKKQLEVSLESGKLNHLIKYVRQRGNNWGRPAENNNRRGKVINMVQRRGKELKRKSPYKQHEEWMHVPITFPPVMADDVSDGPLIVEAEVEGYWVRRVFVDQGAVVQVMFEHCFDHLSPNIKARLTPTQTELVGFSGEQLIPIGKIELEVQFGGGLNPESDDEVHGSTSILSLQHHTRTHGFTRTKSGLVHRTCHAEIIEQEATKEKAEKHKAPEGEEKVLVNPAFSEQAITIAVRHGKNPKWLIRHTLNVNNPVSPVAQKRRLLGTEKSRVVTKEVEE